jgi:hypothetical protein
LNALEASAILAAFNDESISSQNFGDGDESISSEAVHEQIEHTTIASLEARAVSDAFCDVSSIDSTQPASTRSTSTSTEVYPKVASE